MSKKLTTNKFTSILQSATNLANDVAFFKENKGGM